MADWRVMDGSQILNAIGDRCLSNEDIGFVSIALTDEAIARDARTLKQVREILRRIHEWADSSDRSLFDTHGLIEYVKSLQAELEATPSSSEERTTNA
jgi:hypothetical protein